jgi:monothiol glutaredoxin
MSPIVTRFLSTETKQAIDKAIGSAPVVLFMKGTPETPQCGFSRASIQILGLQGVDPAKFAAFNVLEDEALRQGMSCSWTGLEAGREALRVAVLTSVVESRD